MTVSAALAVVALQSQVSGERFYGHTDQALYAAEHAGRNRVEACGSSAGASARLPLG